MVDVAAHAAVHGVVGELVGEFVAASEGVLDFEALQLIGATAGFFPEGAQVGAVDFVFALHLLDHEFGVGDYAEAGVFVFEAPGEDAEEGGVFGVVVGAFAEIFAEAGEDAALLVFDDGSVAGGAGVAAGASVAVGDDEVFGGGWVGAGWEEGRGVHLD